MQAVVLAAGKGTRMRSDHPKVLQLAHGRALLEHVLFTLRSLGNKDPKILIGSGASEVRSYLKAKAKDLNIRPSLVVQNPQRGTGHAVMCARKALSRSAEDVLIWPGDMPLLKKETLVEFIKQHQSSRSDVSVLSAIQPNPTGYGRVLRAGGQFIAIREELDASEQEKRVQEVNTGVYLFKKKALLESLRKIKPNNKKNEYYLTDTIEILAKKDGKIQAFPFATATEALGINSRIDLAAAIKTMNKREVQKHLENGVSIVSPEQTYIEAGVKIGKDTTIFPWTYIESNVKIGAGCQIGPFAKIRKGTQIDNHAVIGSFVEIARSKVGKKVMAKHLSYIGDAVIGDGTNVGAGTIFANYDGKKKHRSTLGKNVLVGSNTVFVSPISAGDHSQTGAGAVVKAGTRMKKKQVYVGVPAKAVEKNKRKKS